MNRYKALLLNNWSVIIIILLSPLLLFAVLFILPTHDDWTSLTTPDFQPFFIKEHFLFYGYHWRPFDTWIGYLVGRNPQLLFPAFNHILVILGHIICSLAVLHLLTTLKYNRSAKNYATVFFFVTPAMMATVSAVDSQNQVFALTFDIFAFLCYVKLKKRKYFVWATLIFLSTLCKENGLMWAIICPLLAYGFDFITKKELKKDVIIGFLIMISYALAIILLPKDIIIHPDYEPGMMKIVKNIVKFLFTSFITVDYIYLLHQPSRNLHFACGTFMMSIPFVYYIFIKQWKVFMCKQMLCTIVCLFIAVGPHIITVFSMMHTYAGLSLIAVIIAFGIHHQKSTKTILLSFIAWIITAFVINIHLIDASIKSGKIGKQMAQEAIQKTGKPVENVYVIIIEDKYSKLSSFCVIPNDAFGWGLAARYETNYQWPKEIQDTTILRNDYAEIEAIKLSKKILNTTNNNCVWIVNHDKINVIRK